MQSIVLGNLDGMAVHVAQSRRQVKRPAPLSAEARRRRALAILCLAKNEFPTSDIAGFFNLTPMHVWRIRKEVEKVAEELGYE